MKPIEKPLIKTKKSLRLMIMPLNQQENSPFDEDTLAYNDPLEPFR